MASPRSVSVFDRATSPLFTPFLARFRHFRRQIGFIYESVPQVIPLRQYETRHKALQSSHCENYLD